MSSRLHFVHWQVTQNATNEEAYAILSQDPIWNCFALADLEPPLRDYSQFAIAVHRERNERAICLILRHPIIGEVLSPFGAEEGVAAIFHQLALPEQPLIQAQEIHIPLLQSYYCPVTAWKKMWRMAISSNSWSPLLPVFHKPLKQLTMADLPALEYFYAQQTEISFSAALFPQGLYFGAYEGERIIAAAGTHALIPTPGIAVLGHILTAPEARGQGYATAITASLVTKLFAQHFSTVVLNVFEENNNAVRIYERLGFQTHHQLVTGKSLLAR